MYFLTLQRNDLRNEVLLISEDEKSDILDSWREKKDLTFESTHPITGEVTVECVRYLNINRMRIQKVNEDGYDGEIGDSDTGGA